MSDYLFPPTVSIFQNQKPIAQGRNMMCISTVIKTAPNQLNTLVPRHTDGMKKQNAPLPKAFSISVPTSIVANPYTMVINVINPIAAAVEPITYPPPSRMRRLRDTLGTF